MVNKVLKSVMKGPTRQRVEGLIHVFHVNSLCKEETG